MHIEDTLIGRIAKPKENLKYVAIDLLTRAYDPQRLVAKAIEQGELQRLAYIAQVTYEAATSKKGVDANCLKSVVDMLQIPDTAHWLHLDTSAPVWGKQIIESYPKTDLEKSTRVHSTMTPEEVADWIDLYITHDYATTPRR